MAIEYQVKGDFELADDLKRLDENPTLGRMCQGSGGLVRPPGGRDTPCEPCRPSLRATPRSFALTVGT